MPKQNTALQLIRPHSKADERRRLSDTRKEFLKHYEATLGNVTASCKMTGIIRATFYRWVRSNSPINKKFQKALAKIQAQERKIDFIEDAYLKLVETGDTAAVLFGLKTIGKSRGYTERPTYQDQEGDQLQQLARNIQKAVELYPQSDLETLINTVSDEMKVNKDRLKTQVDKLLKS